MPEHSLSDYHERSKHRLNRYAPGPGGLDWASQPDPFRRYAGAARVELPLAADELELGYADLRAGRSPAARPLDLDSIGVLFELSLAVSAWKAYGDASWALRCNPSSGNLHPTEGYLITGGVPGIDAGVYHYSSREHLLERRGEWEPDRAPVSEGVFVGLASVHWREAWKYGMRAFRYCQHDCGHAIAALAYAAACLGWRSRVLHSPGDDEVATLLGLDRDGDFDGAEREAPDCLMWMSLDGGEPPGLPGTPSRWHGRANRLSARQVDWPDIDAVHALTVKPPTGSERRAELRAGAPRPLPGAERRAARLIRARRSAVAFDGTTTIAAETFYAMLDAVLPRAAAPPWSAWPRPALVHPALFVHRVDGLAPGLYVLAREPDALDSLRGAMRPEWLWQKAGPPGLPLYLLMPHELRAAAQTVCCHQEIAADSCFALGMIARYGVAKGEPWRYRALHWECGMLGQVLYLEAEAAGIRGTGIGCFFDDEMHALLGLRGPEWQTLYHFTAGGAVEDARLTTLPAYAFSRPRSAARNTR
jgi:SagB-type dehydrogenase family enzyme